MDHHPLHLIFMQSTVVTRVHVGVCNSMDPDPQVPLQIE